MPVDFFEEELTRIKMRFNQTFGVMPLCNPTLRIRVIFAIAQMGVLQTKILKDKEREDISKFVKTKEKLNEIFSTLTKAKERKRHENRNQKPICFDRPMRRAR